MDSLPLPTDWCHLLARYYEHGDEEALNQLLMLVQPWLHRVVRKRMRAHHRLFETSEDVVQETLARLFTHGPRVIPHTVAAFRGYVATIVVNLLRDLNGYAFAVRRDIGRDAQEPHLNTTRLGLAAASADGPSRGLQREDEQNLVRAAMLLLDPEDARVIRMRDWEQLEFPDIGAALNISPSAARMRYNRAVERFGNIVRGLEIGDLSSFAPDPGPNPVA